MNVNVMEFWLEVVQSGHSGHIKTVIDAAWHSARIWYIMFALEDHYFREEFLELNVLRRTILENIRFLHHEKHENTLNKTRPL